MFGNIFNTVMDVKEKIKDIIKTKMNISLFCHYKNMKLVYDRSQVAKSKASFTLDKNA
jgi:hypothetical protein